jgi:type IV secretion system protein VirB4
VDSLLGNSDLFGGLYPMLDNSHLRMISLVGFPLETEAGVLQALEQLPLLFRWSNRFIFLDALSARKLIKTYRRNWFQKRHNMLGLLREVIMPQDGPGFVNTDALNMTADADQAIEEVDSGLVCYGFYSSVIVLYSRNHALIEEGSQIILKQLEHCGFCGKVETINALESYLGSLPAHGYQNIRRPIVHSLNLADFLPTTSVWAGLDSHPCRYYPAQSPPLFYAATVGATPFRFHLHVQCTSVYFR